MARKKYHANPSATTAATGTIIMLAVSALCFAAAPWIIAAFRGDDPDVMATGVAALRAQMLLLPLTGLVTAVNMGLQSTGNSAPATVLSMARQGIFFLPLIMILPRLLGLDGVIIAQPMSDGFSFLLAIVLFFYFMRLLSRKEKENS